jgi:predicted outer membrane repeat protein
VWFISNTADGRGGAINSATSPSSVMRVVFCTFSRNTAEEGGAIFHEIGEMKLANCLFAGNGLINGGIFLPSTQLGGAAWIGDQANTLWQNCVFYDNEASLAGGANYHAAFGGLLADTSFEHFYRSCTFTQNRLEEEVVDQSLVGLGCGNSRRPWACSGKPELASRISTSSTR